MSGSLVTDDRDCSTVYDQIPGNLLFLWQVCLPIKDEVIIMQCITLSVESAPFFIPLTSFCSLSSWFTSSCAYHLITVISHLRSHHLSVTPSAFHSKYLSLSLSQILSSSHSYSFRTTSTDLEPALN